MRKLLRSSDLSVPGSRQHKVWTSYLHTPAAWAERKASWFARLPTSQNANTYLDVLEEQYRTTLQTVLDGWEANEFAEMVIKDGKATLDLSKDEKPPTPATVEPLREAMLRVIPHVRLADVLIEVDDWVGLRGHFTHLNEREAAKTWMWHFLQPCWPMASTCRSPRWRKPLTSPITNSHMSPTGMCAKKRCVGRAWRWWIITTACCSAPLLIPHRPPCPMSFAGASRRTLVSCPVSCPLLRFPPGRDSA